MTRMWLQTDRNVLDRLWIHAPNPSQVLSMEDWRVVRMFDNAFNLAAALTDTRGIRLFSCENTCALTLMIKQERLEKHGEKEMTAADLHPIIRQYCNKILSRYRYCGIKERGYESSCLDTSENGHQFSSQEGANFENE